MVLPQAMAWVQYWFRVLSLKFCGKSKKIAEILSPETLLFSMYVCHLTSAISSWFFDKSVRSWEKKSTLNLFKPYFRLDLEGTKLVKNLVSRDFSKILQKFHFLISISSHFHFTFTSQKRVKAKTFHFSDKSESIFFHFSNSLNSLSLRPDADVIIAHCSKCSICEHWGKATDVVCAQAAGSPLLLTVLLRCC